MSNGIRKNMKADMMMVLGILLAILVIYVLANPGAIKLPIFRPDIQSVSPIDGAILTTNTLTINFEVDNWDIGLNEHIHLQIDGGCGTSRASGLLCITIDQPGTELDGDQIPYRSREPIVLKGVSAGKHDLKLFLVGADHIFAGALDEFTITVNS